MKKCLLEKKKKKKVEIYYLQNVLNSRASLQQTIYNLKLHLRNKSKIKILEYVSKLD